MPVNAKIEYDRDQPGAKTGLSPGIILEQAPETILGQLFAHEQKAIVFPVLLVVKLTRRLHDQRRVPIQDFGPGIPGSG